MSRAPMKITEEEDEEDARKPMVIRERVITRTRNNSKVGGERVAFV